MKLLLVFSMLCIHNLNVPPQEKQKDTVAKKIVKPVKKVKVGAPLYPSILLIDTY
jgi:hypothetical protein